MCARTGLDTGKGMELAPQLCSASRPRIALTFPTSSGLRTLGLCDRAQEYYSTTRTGFVMLINTPYSFFSFTAVRSCAVQYLSRPRSSLKSLPRSLDIARTLKRRQTGLTSSQSRALAGIRPFRKQNLRSLLHMRDVPGSVRLRPDDDRGGKPQVRHEAKDSTKRRLVG